MDIVSQFSLRFGSVSCYNGICCRTTFQVKCPLGNGRCAERRRFFLGIGQRPKSPSMYLNSTVGFKLTSGQHFQTLWIGCADSRVPESVITASKPGDIFVHRNIAKWASLISSHDAPSDTIDSQFFPDDVNALAVLDYAVNFLGVEHGTWNFLSRSHFFRSLWIHSRRRRP